MLQLFLLSLVIGAILSILPRNYHFITLKFHKAPQIPTDKKELHANHMQSVKWRKIRYNRLVKDDFKCQAFHWWPVRNKLQVHHKNYRNLGNEKQRDLITLCQSCHLKIHKRK